MYQWPMYLVAKKRSSRKADDQILDEVERGDRRPQRDFARVRHGGAVHISIVGVFIDEALENLRADIPLAARSQGLAAVEQLVETAGALIRLRAPRRAYVAMKTLGFAISLLRTGGLDDSAISAMVHEILTQPHSTGEYDIGGDGFLPGPDRVAERPWMVGFVPLAGD